MHQYTPCRTDGHMQSLALALSALACKLGKWGWLAPLVSKDPFYHTLLTFQCCILENHLWSPFSYFSSTDAVILEERDSHHYTHTRAKFILSPAAIRKLIVSKSPKLTRELQLFELNNSSQLQLRAVNFNTFRRAYLNLHWGGVFPGNSPWTSPSSCVMVYYVMAWLPTNPVSSQTQRITNKWQEIRPKPQLRSGYKLWTSNSGVPQWSQVSRPG